MLLYHTELVDYKADEYPMLYALCHTVLVDYEVDEHPMLFLRTVGAGLRVGPNGMLYKREIAQER